MTLVIVDVIAVVFIVTVFACILLVMELIFTLISLIYGRKSQNHKIVFRVLIKGFQSNLPMDPRRQQLTNCHGNALGSLTSYTPQLRKFQTWGILIGRNSNTN